MKSAHIGKQGVFFKDAPRPKPGAEQILVQVAAAGLNRADLITLVAAKRGFELGPGGFIGREFCGTVVETGPGVTNFKMGEAVMCTGRNALAEFAVADVHLATSVPLQTTSMEEAAGLPVALNTMHDALVTRGKLEAGQSVLVQGASSGVGLMAQRIAKYMGAALVIGTSTTPARREKLTLFGADVALDSKDPQWVEAVLSATGGRGVDLVIDQVGAPAANANMRAAALEGRIINVGRLGGDKGEFNFDLHALRRINYIGVTFRTRTLQEVRAVTARREADLSAAVAAGKLKLPIDSVFAFEDLENAFSHMGQNKHFGKIIVRL